MNRQRSRATLATIAAVCAVAAMPGQGHAADGPTEYTFDPAAVAVQGAETNADATELKAGSVYRSSIGPGQKLYYRLELDDATDAYVSAVAVPKAGGKVAYGDGITISIRDLDDTRCSSEDAAFESAEFPRPIAAYAHRTVEKDSTTCAASGTYNVLIERESKATSSSEPWELELRHEQEPALKDGGSLPTEAPEDWPSASPVPPVGRQERTGGSGFYDATSLESGEWADSVAPGQTRFYRVPVDWGQQIFATAALSNSGTSTEYLGNALALALDNPAHGHVDDATLSYSGAPNSVALDPLPPVAYENRYDAGADVSAMRFAGWYYLSVTLSPDVAEHYGDGPHRADAQGQGRQRPQAVALPGGRRDLRGHGRRQGHGQERSECARGRCERHDEAGGGCRHRRGLSPGSGAGGVDAAGQAPSRTGRRPADSRKSPAGPLGRLRPG
ncbi:hypothetical protein RKD45_003539 [Streptomyces griseus]